MVNQPEFPWKDLTTEISEKCIKSVQSKQERHQNDVIDFALVSLLLTLIRSDALFKLLTLKK